MTDQWIKILQAFEPSYDNLVKMMDVGSTVKLHLKNRKVDNDTQCWAITLVEEWPNDVRFGDSILDDRVSWADKELDKWHDCWRMAWDTWYFRNRSDAEKFITLYNLTWA